MTKSRFYNITNMPFNAFRKNKILAKISKFTVRIFQCTQCQDEFITHLQAKHYEPSPKSKWNPSSSFCLSLNAMENRAEHDQPTCKLFIPYCSSQRLIWQTMGLLDSILPSLVRTTLLSWVFVSGPYLLQV